MWLELECVVPQIQFFIAWSAVCTTVHYQCHQNEIAKNELDYVSSVYMFNFIFFVLSLLSARARWTSLRWSSSSSW